jgi:AraC family transcriptional regulator
MDEPKPSPALNVALHTSVPGLRTPEAAPYHRVKIHAGAPMRGACRRQPFVYTRGDIDILPAGLSEVWEEQDAGTAILLELSPGLLQQAAQGTGLPPGRRGLEPRCQLRDAQIEHIGWALEAERRGGYPGGRLYAESLGLALAVRLLGFAAPPAIGGRLSSTQLARVVEHVEQSLDEDLSLARLAAVAGVSASHFKTLFRRSTGQSVHRYVIERRVERAKALLASGMPGSRAALEAGFAHQSHMARWMRRTLGVTPSAFIDRPRSAALPASASDRTRPRTG